MATAEPHREIYESPPYSRILSPAQTQRVISDLKAVHITRAHLVHIEGDLPDKYLDKLLSQISALLGSVGMI